LDEREVEAHVEGLLEILEIEAGGGMSRLKMEREVDMAC